MSEKSGVELAKILIETEFDLGLTKDEAMSISQALLDCVEALEWIESTITGEHFEGDVIHKAKEILKKLRRPSK